MTRERRADAIVVAISGSILLGSVILFLAPGHGRELLPEGSLCWSRILLGRDCPGCGMTRSFIAMGGGQLGHALAYNPLGPVLFATLALLVVLHALRLAGVRIPRLGTIDGVLAAAVSGMVVAHAIVFYLL